MTAERVLLKVAWGSMFSIPLVYPACAYLLGMESKDWPALGLAFLGLGAAQWFLLEAHRRMNQPRHRGK